MTFFSERMIAWISTPKYPNFLRLGKLCSFNMDCGESRWTIFFFFGIFSSSFFFPLCLPKSISPLDGFIKSYRSTESLLDVQPFSHTHSSISNEFEIWAEFILINLMKNLKISDLNIHVNFSIGLESTTVTRGSRQN